MKCLYVPRTLGTRCFLFSNHRVAFEILQLICTDSRTADVRSCLTDTILLMRRKRGNDNANRNCAGTHLWEVCYLISDNFLTWLYLESRELSPVNKSVLSYIYVSSYICLRYQCCLLCLQIKSSSIITE